MCCIRVSIRYHRVVFESGEPRCRPGSCVQQAPGNGVLPDLTGICAERSTEISVSGSGRLF